MFPPAQLDMPEEDRAAIERLARMRAQLDAHTTLIDHLRSALHQCHKTIAKQTDTVAAAKIVLEIWGYLMLGDWTRALPTEPGWYWCWSTVDDTPTGDWMAVVRIDKDVRTGKLFCVWLTSPFEQATKLVDLDEINPDTRWIKLTSPTPPQLPWLQ